MTVQADRIDTLLAGVRIMPVVVIEDVAHAVPMASALFKGGLRAIEITLRTPVAIDAVKAIREQVPDMIVGTGTILSPADLHRSAEAGAVFAVSPGLTDPVANAAMDMVEDMPLLPGTATASEVMCALDHGFERLKFFPAEAAGGIPLLKSLGSPLPKARFCPTGGITEQTATDYLSLANVFCVGGSWLTPRTAIMAENWSDIEGRAGKAATL